MKWDNVCKELSIGSDTYCVFSKCYDDEDDAENDGD